MFCSLFGCSLRYRNPLLFAGFLRIDQNQKYQQVACPLFIDNKAVDFYLYFYRSLQENCLNRRQKPSLDYLQSTRTVQYIQLDQRISFSVLSKLFSSPCNLEHIEYSSVPCQSVCKILLCSVKFQCCFLSCLLVNEPVSAQFLHYCLLQQESL